MADQSQTTLVQAYMQEVVAEDGGNNTGLEMATLETSQTTNEVLIGAPITVVEENTNVQMETLPGSLGESEQFLLDNLDYGHIDGGNLFHGTEENRDLESLQQKYLKRRVMLATMSATTKGVVLAVCILFAGGSFATLANYGSFISKDRKSASAEFLVINIKDMVCAPNQLPAGFYLIASTTLTFAVSMVMIPVFLCSMEMPCSFFVKLLLLFTTSTTFATYVIMVRMFLPRFSISTIGSIKVSSFWLMWLFDLVLVVLVLTIGIVVEQVMGTSNILMEK